jgi:protein-tyrosine-phosphatase
MAAALLDDRAAGRVVVRSAGSAPADTIDPVVVDVLREVGLDIGDEFPKPVTDDAVRAADVVVTMGCGDACVFYPGKHYEDWQIDDPAGKDIDTVRRIRDEIDARVRRLIEQVTRNSIDPDIRIAGG